MQRKMEEAEFDKLKKESHRIIVYQEFDAEEILPVQAFEALQSDSKISSLFEIVEEVGGKTKKSSFLGIQPIAIFKSKNEHVEITNEGVKEEKNGDVYNELRRFFKRFAPSSKSILPRFADGMFGFVAYDSVRLMLKLPNLLPDPEDIPDFYFIIYETIVTFDLESKKMTICVSVKNTSNYEDAIKKIEAIKQKISKHAFSFTMPTKEADLKVDVDIEDEEYYERVVQAKEYLLKGQIFQMVISRSFSTPVRATPFQVYLTLSKLNPSPYMFLFNTEDFSIVGASPEKLVSNKEGYIETMPVGGTHPRSQDKTLEEMKKALLSDEKEIAEHIMKMEVGRNDLNSVAEPKTVEVIELAGTRAFSHVLHIITKVGARLRKDKDTIDVIKAMLPAAPIAGSPKRRALELIEQLEKTRRGFYGGAICLIDSKDNLLSSLTIRSILIKKGIAKVRAGATIVAYSDPVYESKESRHKAQAPLKALKLIEGTFQ